MHQLIDSHCHFDDPRLQALQPNLWQSCLREGVEQLVVPGTLQAHFARQIALCDTHSDWHLALGLHPYFSHCHTQPHLDQLPNLLEEHNPVAVGEIGLDFALSMQQEGFSQSQQEYWFTSQVRIAQAFNLPIIVHSRKANDRLGQLLRQIGFEHGGIVHAFSGSLQQAQAFTKLGFKIGLGGTLTYERAKAMRRLAAALPLSDIVLETDAPDMPMAGQPKDQPNRPDHLPRVLKVIASLRKESLAQITSRVYENTQQVLRLNQT